MADNKPSASAALERLIAIMAQLRNPDGGCPWDIEQNFATIAPYTIEEAYEVADAIAEDDMAGLKHELGDLLLQVVFHARMAEEAGLFAFADVAEAINDKMVRRHPHVFADDTQRTAEEQTHAWEAIKAEERAAGAGDARPASAMDGVPRALPALLRAHKLGKRAARAGFDWPDVGGIVAKVHEEIDELNAELARAPNDGDQARIEQEIGDILFTVAQVARRLGVDPETALRGANTKVERRFRFVEDRLRAHGRTPAEANMDELEALWQEAKTAAK